MFSDVLIMQRNSTLVLAKLFTFNILQKNLFTEQAPQKGFLSFLCFFASYIGVNGYAILEGCAFFCVRRLESG